MTRRTAAILLLGTLCFVAGGRANEAIVSLWRPATWNGERAFEAATPRWLAIVSVERARLVYLGGRDGTHNLLFAPSTRNDPAGWGGHRLWLGPQSTWSRGWPPPDAWEKSGAENVRVDGARLELKLADAGDGWPRLTRVYRWEEDGRLHCEALSNGGTRSAQFIHIVQVPAEAEVEVHSAPRPDLPVGYAQLHLGRTPSPQRKFQPLPHVSESAGVLHLRVANVKEKLGFEPQPLVARSEGSGLRVERGVSDGVLLAAPDEGLFTQVYLGDNHTPFIELEQLSPLWKAGSAARCEIILEPQEN